MNWYIGICRYTICTYAVLHRNDYSVCTNAVLHRNDCSICTYAILHRNDYSLCKYAVPHKNDYSICTNALLHRNDYSMCTYAVLKSICTLHSILHYLVGILLITAFSKNLLPKDLVFYNHLYHTFAPFLG